MNIDSKYSSINFTFIKSFVPCSAPICNPCPDLKSLLARFVISARFEIPLAAPICNPSCPDL